MSERTQPGLEVGADPNANPHSGWPQESKSAWGANQSEYPLTGTGPQSRRILGLSVGTLWAIMVLICVLLAGGIWGGVGARLASRKTNCPSLNTSSSGAPTGNAQTASSSSSATSGSQAATSSPTLTTSGSATSTSATPSVSPAPSSKYETETRFNGLSLVPLDATGNGIPLGNIVQQTFMVFCNTNWPGGSASGNPGLHDIVKYISQI